MSYRIVAARDGTRLEYDPAIPPGAPTTMNAGEVALFRHGTGDVFVVRTQDPEHPIYVSAHMTGGAGDFSGRSYGGLGDPEFVNVIPTAQYLSSYSFYVDRPFTATVWGWDSYASYAYPGGTAQRKLVETSLTSIQ